MRVFAISLFAGLAIVAAGAPPPQKPGASGPYKVLQTARVGGDGSFDYVYAVSAARKLYVARRGTSARISIFDLDTLEQVGEISKTGAHGVAVDTKSHRGFASSKPVAVWDSKTFAPIKTIDVEGDPDGIMADPFNERVYVFSHDAPNVTVINAKTGFVLGTIDLGGAPEQAASDGKGLIYVDLEDKDSVAVFDAKTMKVRGTLSLNGKGGTCAGLAMDTKNNVLFVACRKPHVMVMLDAKTGKYIADLPIGNGCDGVVFNPKTKEAISAQADGTLTVIKEQSKSKFVVEQNLKTMVGAKTLTMDTKKNRIILISAEYKAPASGTRGTRGTMVPGSFSIIVVGSK